MGLSLFGAALRPWGFILRSSSCWGCIDINIVILATGAKGIVLVMNLCDLYYYKGTSIMLNDRDPLLVGGEGGGEFHTIKKDHNL